MVSYIGYCFSEKFIRSFGIINIAKDVRTIVNLQADFLGGQNYELFKQCFITFRITFISC